MEDVDHLRAIARLERAGAVFLEGALEALLDERGDATDPALLIEAALLATDIDGEARVTSDPVLRPDVGADEVP